MRQQPYKTQLQLTRMNDKDKGMLTLQPTDRRDPPQTHFHYTVYKFTYNFSIK